MKITRITATNYIGARSIDARLTKPVAIFAGANYAGKSSLREGVLHALTGRSGRVDLKKEYPHLVFEGAKTGVCIVESSDGKAAITLPNGAHEMEFEPLPSLPYVLDAQYFSRHDAKGRRAFLFGLMGLSESADAVRAELLKIGATKENVEQVIPLLRAGFDAACAEAHDHAKAAKAAWRVVTGETYGGQKALTWTAKAAAFDEKRLKHAQAALEETRRALAEANTTIGATKAKHVASLTRQKRIEELSGVAETYSRWADKLAIDEAQLAEWNAKVEAVQNRLKGAPMKATAFCPCCEARLVIEKNGTLAKYVDEGELTPAERAEFAEQLEQYTKARDLLKKSVDNDRKQRDQADAAAKQKALLEEEDREPSHSVAEAEEQVAHAATLEANAKALQSDIDMLTQSQRDAATADKRTDDARKHHEAVAQWELIAEALSPNGIPGAMLKNALQPINTRLAESSEFAQWLPVQIDAEMRITANGRDYRLFSESEKFRADALIAEAISHLSGLKLLVLDRMDVLDVQGRKDLIEWLDAWAEAGEVDTALIFGTLKARPVIKYDSVESFWIEAGTITDTEIAKAA